MAAPPSVNSKYSTWPRAVAAIRPDPCLNKRLAGLVLSSACSPGAHDRAARPSSATLDQQAEVRGSRASASSSSCFLSPSRLGGTRPSAARRTHGPRAEPVNPVSWVRIALPHHPQAGRESGESGLRHPVLCGPNGEAQRSRDAEHRRQRRVHDSLHSDFATACSLRRNEPSQDYRF